MVKYGSRRCLSHFKDNKDLLKEGDIRELDDTISMNSTDIESILKKINCEPNSIYQQLKNVSDLSNSIVKEFTFLDASEMIYLSNLIREEKAMRDSTNKTISQALAIYWFLMKTGLDQKTIALFFGFNDRLQVQKACSQVTNYLKKVFVKSF